MYKLLYIQTALFYEVHCVGQKTQRFSLQFHFYINSGGFRTVDTEDVPTLVQTLSFVFKESLQVNCQQKDL